MVLKDGVRKIFGFALLAIVLSGLSKDQQPNEKGYFLVDINGIGMSRVETVKQTEGVAWWIEAGKTLLVFGSNSLMTHVNEPIKKLALAPNLGRLYTVQRAHNGNLAGDNIEIVVQGGRQAVVQTTDDRLPQLVDLHKHESPGESWQHAHAKVGLFQPNVVLTRQASNDTKNKKTISWPEKISDIVNTVDRDRWFGDIEYLAGLNRHISQTGVVTARDWLATQFEDLGLDVTLQAFPVGARTVHNVIGVQMGTERPDEWYIVGGHYDSTSENVSRAAPGAEDNASGSAGVLEMARVFAEYPPAATIIFIGFSGEEQGLYGSRYHVSQLIDAEDQDKVQAVLNMDMIGYSNTPDTALEVLLETERIGEDFMNTLEAAAEEFTDLEVFTTFDAFGSDHVPYLDRDIPAVLTIDNDYPRYPAYHRTSDTPDMVVPNMGFGILRMNVGALAALAM